MSCFFRNCLGIPRPFLRQWRACVPLLRVYAGRGTESIYRMFRELRHVRVSTLRFASKDVLTIFIVVLEVVELMYQTNEEVARTQAYLHI